MSKSEKIKQLLTDKQIPSTEFAKFLNLPRRQALNTKYQRDSFTGDDLIKLASLTGTRLAFVDPETEKTIVYFEEEDAISNKSK